MQAFLQSIGYQHWILNVLLLLPMLGVVLVLVAPERWARWLTLVVATAEFVLALGLWWAFDSAMGGMQFTTSLPWLPEFGIHYRIGLDGLSLFMILLATAMMPLLVWGSWFAIDTKVRGYYALLLALKTGMIGVFVAMDLFLFYCFWELLLIPMYFLIGTWGSANRLYAATKFVVYTFAGSVMMLVAIIAMVVLVGKGTGEYSFAYDHLVQNRDLLAPWAPYLFTAFALAFAVKVPIFPLHTWLPDAHVEAPTAGSVDLAVILLKMGTYGFLRFAIPFFPAFALSAPVAAVFVTLAVSGIIYAALVSMVQPDLKKLIAYSSVSHLGFVMLGIWGGSLQSVQGALMVMISHGFSTGALFLLIGMLYERRHTRLLADYGGIARVVPVFSLILTVVSLSSIGLPGLNGFVGEFLVLLGSFSTYPWATGIATTGVIFAAAYLLWALQRIIFNRLDHAENESLTDLTPRELAVMAPLLAGILWLGLYPGPVLRRMEPASQRYLQLVGRATETPRPVAEARP